MNLLAEKNVIGSLLADPKSVGDVSDFLTAEMFTAPVLGRMYLEFQRAYDNRYPINLAVLVEKIQSDETPESVIVDVAKECVMLTTTSAYIKSYANSVLRSYKADTLRKVINAVDLSADGIDQKIDNLMLELQALQGNKQVEAKTLAQVTKENKEKYFREDTTPKLMTGINAVDDLVGGLEGGDMIVIGARPGVGKSALVTQITSHFAQLGKKVGFYNLEMREKQVYERFVVSESGISLSRLKNAVCFLGDEEERFRKANEVLESRTNIILNTGGGKKVSEIRNESRHMDYDIIIVDYLQLLQPDSTYRGNRVAEVGNISKALKQMAMEFDIPVIALSQLNRASEARETKEPTMSDLREAGDIEQDASIIILLWNVNENDLTKKGIKVEKNRQGIPGKSVLVFDGEHMRFSSSKESIGEASAWDYGETPFG